MNIHEMLLKQLDPRLNLWRQANQEAPRPRNGWVKTIRKALGMTLGQLAERLQVDPSRVVKIEIAEPKDAVTLKTLREVARALECDLVYALVPKKSLKSILENKARNIFKSRVQQVSHSMALEGQAVSKEYQEAQIEELVRQLLAKPRLLNSIWNENKPPHKKQSSLHRKGFKRKPNRKI